MTLPWALLAATFDMQYTVPDPLQLHISRRAASGCHPSYGACSTSMLQLGQDVKPARTQSPAHFLLAYTKRLKLLRRQAIEVVKGAPLALRDDQVNGPGGLIHPKPMEELLAPGNAWLG